jgi:hypothetical protein
VLRLPWEVNPLFQQWLQQHLPERAPTRASAAASWRACARCAAAADNDSRFGIAA